MIYVSIDLSIKSPGVAIHYTVGNEPKTILYSYTEYNVPSSVVGKFNESSYVIAIMHNDIEKVIKSSGSTLKESYFKRLKINAIEFGKFIDYLLNEYVLPYADDKHLKFSIEGYSYNARGMAYDIAEFGGIIKYVIENKYNTEIKVIEPTRIKKFACKGNAKKDEMVEAAMSSNPTLKSIFESMLPTYKKPKSTKNPLYESPFNDLVDAYFQLLYFINGEKNAGS